jgi:hypothetical protein
LSASRATSTRRRTRRRSTRLALADPDAGRPSLRSAGCETPRASG